MTDKKVESYISRQKMPQKEICQQLRDLILKTLPEIKEELRWGVPTFGAGEVYIVSLKDHVNLGFSLKYLSEQERAGLGGNGKTMKHLEIAETKDIDEEKIIHLLKLVHVESTEAQD